MRLIRIAPGEYYHIFNRAVNKQVIFHNTSDYFRFLFLTLYFQSPIIFQQLGRKVKEFVQSRALDNVEEDEIIKKRRVELVAFCIMPNHFHLIVKELDEGGIAAYMHRNPREISKWFKKEDQYIWSSYQDFIDENRWGDLIMPDIVIGQFKDKAEYENFVKTSPAKIKEEELEYLAEL